MVLLPVSVIVIHAKPSHVTVLWLKEYLSAYQICTVSSGLGRSDYVNRYKGTL